MRDAERLHQLYMELYRLYVCYGEDKTVAQLFYQMAELNMYHIEDDKIIPELYRMLGLTDDNRQPTKDCQIVFEILYHTHMEECPDLRLGQLIAELGPIAVENIYESAGTFLMETGAYLHKKYYC